MASATLIVGGLVAAIVAAVAALVVTEVVSAAGLAGNALWGLLPTLFAIAAIMGVLIAAFGVFLGG